MDSVVERARDSVGKVDIALKEMADEIERLSEVCDTDMAQIKHMMGELDRMKAVNERDRSQVAEVFTAIMDAIRRREWLRLGRGSYEYDDDRWRDEFGEAIDEVVAASKPLQRIAGDLSDCPTDSKEIALSRMQALAHHPQG